MKKRRLEDLYVVGRYVEFDDGDGDPLKVYLRKLTPVDMELALRNANAAKSKYLAARKDPESQRYLDVLVGNQEITQDRDACISLLVEDRLAKTRLSVEAELAEEEEWSKDDYLQGLRDAWTDSLRNGTSQEEEPQQVWQELKRFNAAVGTHMESAREAETKSLEVWSDQQLTDETMKVLMRVRAEMAWLSELRLSEVWLALRDTASSRERYYQEREGLNDLPREVLGKLLDDYQAMVVEVGEGKDSRRTQDSSASSEPPSEEATSASSGPQVVAR